VPAEGNGDLQTLICVPVARPRRPTLSNPVPWQNWMAAYLGYTLRMKTLFRGWPVMVHDTHAIRRRAEKSWCAAVRLKHECFQLSSEFRLVGKLFQIRGPAAAKHLSPKRLWTRVTEHFVPEDDHEGASRTLYILCFIALIFASWQW